jgi:Skp family chaperone for outer membrane proteins
MSSRLSFGSLRQQVQDEKEILEKEVEAYAGEMSRRIETILEEMLENPTAETALTEKQKLEGEFRIEMQAKIKEINRKQTLIVSYTCGNCVRVLKSLHRQQGLTTGGNQQPTGS